MYQEAGEGEVDLAAAAGVRGDVAGRGGCAGHVGEVSGGMGVEQERAGGARGAT